MPDPKTLEREIGQNYDVFMAQMEDLLQDNREGQYALIRCREIIGFFNSAGEAVRAGDSMFGDRLFSVQEVRSKPSDLGYFSHGGALRDL